MPRITLAFALALLPTLAAAQDEPEPYRVEDHYEKTEHRIPMRDGVELFTAVYRPKDATADHPYPILINRTPYAVGPYGEDKFPGRLAPSRAMTEEGYIVVHQDVRGRYMSDGEYDNMRPHVPGDAAIDESSDTYDTIEWLLEHVEGHNGKVGIWGISYPGFYAAAALPEAHPALVAASPQAPISDFYFDDFHHRGAFTLDYLLITSVFTFQKDEPDHRSLVPARHARDARRLQVLPRPRPAPERRQVLQRRRLLLAADRRAPRLRRLLAGPEHPAAPPRRPHRRHDRRRLVRRRGPLRAAAHLRGDREELPGPTTPSSWAPGATATGPAAPARRSSATSASARTSSKHYQEDVEARFFRHFLKGEGDPTGLPEAHVFDTGRKEWSEFDAWPPSAAEAATARLRRPRDPRPKSPAGGDDDDRLHRVRQRPGPPGPRLREIRLVMTPRAYMTDDQRFASRRPDVVSFRSEPLEEDLTLAGPLEATLFVSTTGTDADWVVKLIDVSPRRPAGDRGHARRGRPRRLRAARPRRDRPRPLPRLFEDPEPFIPGEITTVIVPLQDVYHTFKKGHPSSSTSRAAGSPSSTATPRSTWRTSTRRTPRTSSPATHRVYHAPSTRATWTCRSFRAVSLRQTNAEHADSMRSFERSRTVLRRVGVLVRSNRSTPRRDRSDESLGQGPRSHPSWHLRCKHRLRGAVPAPETARLRGRIPGDHHIFTRGGVEEILNLQPRGTLAKAYQVRQVREVILRYRLAGSDYVD